MNLRNPSPKNCGFLGNLKTQPLAMVVALRTRFLGFNLTLSYGKAGKSP